MAARPRGRGRGRARGWPAPWELGGSTGIGRGGAPPPPIMNLSIGTLVPDHLLESMGLQQSIIGPMQKVDINSDLRKLKEVPKYDWRGFPASWDPMGPGETSIMVELPRDSEEFGDIASLLMAQVEDAEVITILRLQNGFSWLKYLTNIQEEATKLEGKRVHIQRLFHGTKNQIIKRN